MKREYSDLMLETKMKLSEHGYYEAKPETFRRSEAKIGRNDPCPCRSGKKYKRCHMRAETPNVRRKT